MTEKDRGETGSYPSWEEFKKYPSFSLTGYACNLQSISYAVLIEMMAFLIGSFLYLQSWWKTGLVVYALGFIIGVGCFYFLRCQSQEIRRVMNADSKGNQ